MGIHQQQHTMDITDKIVQISFSDNRIPEFKETKGVDYIKFGEDDKFPEHTLMLYNKSAKHNAIVNGKVNYIFGGGLVSDQPNDLKANAFLKEIEKIDSQTIKDIELHGGFAWEIIPTKGGGFIPYHIDFNNIRSNEDNTVFYYKKNWSDRSEERKVYPVFKQGLKESSIFYYKEYRPGLKTYPLPGYVASFNYIEADIEVSKHTLTNAQTGFSASKFINFYNGDPTEEGKIDVTRRFEILATGSEGKKMIIGFNNPGTQSPTIDDLGASDLTKEDFSHVDNLITNNIFAGAQITHPLLFGIQQEGKLGNSSELRIAYDIFKNTYVNGKQKQFEDIINFFAKLRGISATYKLKDVEPVGFEFSEAAILSVAPKEWLLEKLGIDAQLYPSTAIPVKSEQLSEQTVNENVKNLSAKQHQQLSRIIRQYSKDQLTRQQATILLKTGLGFTDEEVNGLLGIDETPQAFGSDDDLFATFELHGVNRSEFEVIRTKEATFDSDDESFELAQAFKDAPQTSSGGSAIAGKTPPPATSAFPKFMIRYSYEVRENEGPELLPTSRPFCVKMIGLDRFYSRQDIQSISSALGYNVFDRVGGYWNDNGTIKKHCRHFWKANIVVKK